MSLEDQFVRSANRLTKWRTVFAGWQLGSRPMSDPEAQAVRDHRDATMLLRVEVSAILNLCIKAGVFSRNEFLQQAIEECRQLELMYEKNFPGFKATDTGMDMKMPEAAETIKNWRP